jgi:hypothetical protein
MNWQKQMAIYATPFLAAAVEAFAEDLVNSGGHLDKTTVTRAMLAAVVADLALIKAMKAAGKADVS